MVGHDSTHLKDTSQFVNDLEKSDISWNTVTMASFDVVSLFTNVDVDEALNVLSEKMSVHTEWKNYTFMSKERIIQLCDMCIRYNHFIFMGQYYSQSSGLAMGSPLSPLLANLYMEHLEQKCMNISLQKVLLYRRYVDDCFVVCPAVNQVQQFLKEFNNTDPSGKIRLTLELEKNGKLPFLDCMVNREQGKLQLSVYRKPTHSGRVLHFKSAQPKSHMAGTIDSLTRRCYQVCSDLEMKVNEKEYLKSVFINCGYPIGFVEKNMNPVRPSKKRDIPTTTVSIPYVKGVSEKIRSILKRFDTKVYFQKHCTIGRLLCKNSPEYAKEEQKNLVYEISCKDCPKSYVGMTERKVKSRMKEHQKMIEKKDRKSALAKHSIDSGHTIDMEGFSIRSLASDKRDQLLAREALIICSTPNTLNKVECTPHSSFVNILKKKN